ncbi:MAG: hypothetical protein JF584_01270 [Acidobacteria bacterium]|nr:hypothetical protein [Acidobacteriota bacterium]
MFLLLFCLANSFHTFAQAPAAVAKEDEGKDNDTLIRQEQIHNPILWHEPGDIRSLDLFYGQGGRKAQPVAPFSFEKEVRSQSTPKFDARDTAGKRWRVKLGHEARPEVVSSRLLWAVGYFASDDYVLPSAEISGIHMHRGKKYVKGERITDARFARKPSGQKKVYTWRWKENPFTGTRELNGLRVMMALLNSWDLKDENNAIFYDKNNDRQIFLVSDIGTTFGRTGLHFTNGPSKDNVKAYVNSKFILRTTETTVDFATPSRTPSLLLETLGFGIKQYLRRNNMVWIGRGVPRKDAHWVGALLGQLSHRQLVDAFRAGNYPPEDIDQFVRVLEQRIAELKAL